MTFTLLWVEDDPDDLLLGGRAMRKAGFEKPMVARDGEEAIAYLAGHGRFAHRLEHPLPSLVLLDLKLPRKSGFEVMRWIRGREGLKRTPLVVLSSSQERHDIERAYDCGANAYLVKPVATKMFVEILRGLHLFWATFNNTVDSALVQPSSR